MCLILFALQQHPEYPLIVAANRDEFFERPAEAAHNWADHPGIFAGRDLSAGGTWLGINSEGNFAALTNFREPGSINPKNNLLSRGELPTGFLKQTHSPESYFEQLQHSQGDYNGYNLLAGNGQQLGYFSNRGDHAMALEPAIYGLSNGLIDTPWPKVSTGKQQLQGIVTTAQDTPVSKGKLAEQLFEMLGCAEQAPDHQLPNTGVGLEWERTLSPRFILGDIYGTRTSTVLLFHKDGAIDFYEKNFGPEKTQLNENHRYFAPPSATADQ